MSYSVGESVKGTVSGITSFGAFVKLAGGGSGLIHISRLSRSYVTDVLSVVRIGDEVEATVISVDGDRIALSLIGADMRPKRPKNETHGKNDFESMLDSFRSESGERLSALGAPRDKAVRRGRKR